MNVFQGIKEMKPHLFKYDCRSCHRAGLLKCPKCDGRGMIKLARIRQAASGAFNVRLGDQMASPSAGGMLDCAYCKGTGVAKCDTCKGQGWSFQNNINYRKFMPKPIFENFHWNRMFGKDHDAEKTIEKKALKQTFRTQAKLARAKEAAERKARKQANREAKQGLQRA